MLPSKVHAADTDTCLIRLDPDGAILWQHIHQGSGYFEDVRALIERSEGGFLVVAGADAYDSSAGVIGQEAWVLALDADGTTEWQRRYTDGSDDQVSCAAAALDGGTFLGGYVHDPLGTLHYRPWLLKIDEGGQIEWQWRIEDHDMLLTGVTATPDGGVLAVGWGYTSYAGSISTSLSASSALSSQARGPESSRSSRPPTITLSLLPLLPGYHDRPSPWPDAPAGPQPIPCRTLPPTPGPRTRRRSPRQPGCARPLSSRRPALRRLLRLLPVLALLLVWPARAGSLQDAVAAIPDPHATGAGWVYDPTGTLGPRLAEVNASIEALERETGAEIGVAILPEIGEEVPKEFATALFAQWGVGKQGRDDGVLLLHVLDQRAVEIEVGYGLEGALTDARCGEILDDVTIPAFRDGDFPGGISKTVEVLATEVRAAKAHTPSTASTPSRGGPCAVGCAQPAGWCSAWSV